MTFNVDYASFTLSHLEKYNKLDVRTLEILKEECQKQLASVPEDLKNEFKEEIKYLNKAVVEINKRLSNEKL